jgi:hypothetical protein
MAWQAPPRERLTPAVPARPSILAHVARVLRGDAARVAVTFIGATGAVMLGQVLAVLITHC